MGATHEILDAIKQGNNATAVDIAAKTQLPVRMIQGVLWRLSTKGRVVRQKMNSHASKGPRSVYAYTIGEKECQVNHQHKQE
jgi:predicted transcriptional regulator